MFANTWWLFHRTQRGVLHRKNLVARIQLLHENCHKVNIHSMNYTPLPKIKKTNTFLCNNCFQWSLYTDHMKIEYSKREKNELFFPEGYCQYQQTYSNTKNYWSVSRETHYVSFEDHMIHYHKDHSSFYQTRCHNNDNVCYYSIFMLIFQSQDTLGPQQQINQIIQKQPINKTIQIHTLLKYLMIQYSMKMTTVYCPTLLFLCFQTENKQVFL